MYRFVVKSGKDQPKEDTSWMKFMKDKLKNSIIGLKNLFVKDSSTVLQGAPNPRHHHLHKSKSNTNSMICSSLPKKGTIGHREIPQRYSISKLDEEMEKRPTFLNVVNYHKNIYTRKMNNESMSEDPKYVFHHIQCHLKPQPRLSICGPQVWSEEVSLNTPSESIRDRDHLKQEYTEDSYYQSEMSTGQKSVSKRREQGKKSGWKAFDFKASPKVSKDTVLQKRPNPNGFKDNLVKKLVNNGRISLTKKSSENIKLSFSHRQRKAGTNLCKAKMFGKLDCIEQLSKEVSEPTETYHETEKSFEYDLEDEVVPFNGFSLGRFLNDPRGKNDPTELSLENEVEFDRLQAQEFNTIALSPVEPAEQETPLYSIFSKDFDSNNYSHRNNNFALNIGNPTDNEEFKGNMTDKTLPSEPLFKSPMSRKPLFEYPTLNFNTERENTVFNQELNQDKGNFSTNKSPLNTFTNTNKYELIYSEPCSNLDERRFFDNQRHFENQQINNQIDNENSSPIQRGGFLQTERGLNSFKTPPSLFMNIMKKN